MGKPFAFCVPYFYHKAGFAQKPPYPFGTLVAVLTLYLGYLGTSKLNPKAMKSNRLFSLLACIAMLFTFGVASAQTEPATEGGKGGSLQVGFRLGTTYSKFLFNDAGFSESADYNRRRVGFTGGGFVTYNFSKWVGVSGEVLYSQTGTNNINYQVGNIAGTTDYKTSNIALNLLADIRLPVISVYEPRFYVGPSFDFIVDGWNERYTGAAGSISYVGSAKGATDATNQFKVLDFGMIVGAGLDFDLKFAKLKLDARYRQGLNNINNKTNQSLNRYLVGKDMHSSSWIFTAGLAFPLGK